MIKFSSVFVKSFCCLIIYIQYASKTSNFHTLQLKGRIYMCISNVDELKTVLCACIVHF